MSTISLTANQYKELNKIQAFLNSYPVTLHNTPWTEIWVGSFKVEIHRASAIPRLDRKNYPWEAIETSGVSVHAKVCARR